MVKYEKKVFKIKYIIKDAITYTTFLTFDKKYSIVVLYIFKIIKMYTLLLNSKISTFKQDRCKFYFKNSKSYV